MLKIQFPILLLSLLLSACSGKIGGAGANGAAASSGASASTNVVSGTVSAGPISAAVITAYALNTNGSKGAQLATAVTGSDGAYSLSLPAHNGPVILVAGGGSYQEEAGGSTVSMRAAQLRVLLPSVSAGQQVGITPVTEISTQFALGAIAVNSASPASIINSANAATASAMGLSDITIPPANPNMAASSASSTAAAKYALVLATISQLAKNASTGSSTVSSLDMMQALATAFTYNRSFSATVGGSNIPVPNSSGAAISLATVLGSGGFGSAMHSAMGTVAATLPPGFNSSGVVPPPVFVATPALPNGSPSLAVPPPPPSLPTTSPTVSGPPAPPLAYGWNQGGFGACSADCGGGTQTQDVYCANNLGQAVASSYCAGTEPATSQACNTQACPVVGACGSAEGVAVAAAPGANLCSAGVASSVSGSGPFTWFCGGTGGGASASCSAPLEAGNSETATSTATATTGGGTSGSGTGGGSSSGTGTSVTLGLGTTASGLSSVAAGCATEPRGTAAGDPFLNLKFVSVYTASPVGAPAYYSPGAVIGCGITVDSAAYCWPSAGGNVPALVNTSIKLKSIYLVEQTVCGIDVNNALYCWAGSIFNTAPTAIFPGTQFQSVSSIGGASPMCALRTDGQVQCWTWPGAAGAQAPTTAAITMPDPAHSYTKYIDSEFLGAACGITTGGDIYCSGYDLDTAANYPLHQMNAGGVKFKDIAVDWATFFALSTDGHLYEWGTKKVFEASVNDFPRIFGGFIPQSVYLETIQATPALVLPDQTFASLSANGDCALQADGTPVCWGTGYQYGLLGFQPVAGTLAGEDYFNQQGASAVFSGPKLQSLSVGGNSSFACGVTTTQDIYCWGTNSSGELGIGTQSLVNYLPNFVGVPNPSFAGTATCSTDGASAPAAPAFENTSFISISGHDHMAHCGLTGDGLAYCWGNNTQAMLGQAASPLWEPRPTPVDGGLQYKAISVGITTACAITQATGALYCWGGYLDFPDSIAYGDAEYSALLTFQPHLMSSSLSFASVSLGGESGCGLTTAHKAYCWGANFYGALGNNDASLATQNSPVAVATNLTFSKISTNGFSTCAISTAGGMYCWGQTGYGTSSMLPVPVNQGIEFQDLMVNPSSMCGLSTAGQMYCGQYTTLQEVYSGYAFKSIGPKGGLLTDGTLELWDFYDGGFSASDLPIAPSPTTLKFSQVADKGSCAITATGSAYCWDGCMNGDGSIKCGFDADTGPGTETAAARSLTPVLVQVPVHGAIPALGSSATPVPAQTSVAASLVSLNVTVPVPANTLGGLSPLFPYTLASLTSSSGITTSGLTSGMSYPLPAENSGGTYNFLNFNILIDPSAFPSSVSGTVNVDLTLPAIVSGSAPARTATLEFTLSGALSSCVTVTLNASLPPAGVIDYNIPQTTAQYCR